MNLVTVVGRTQIGGELLNKFLVMTGGDKKHLGVCVNPSATGPMWRVIFNDESNRT